MTHIVLTGANRGIGAQMMQQLQARGDTVTAAARNGTGFAHLDVADPASITTFAAGINDPVDLLVCNAGVYLDKHHEIETGFAPDLWAQSFAVNVTGVFLTIQAMLPALQRAKAPKIAVIASQMGSSERANGHSYIYRASKAAAINLARNLSIDLAPKGVAIGAYHPGWVRTDMGGEEADIDAATSAAGLIGCFDRLGPKHTSVFENYDGSTMPF